MIPCGVTLLQSLWPTIMILKKWGKWEKRRNTTRLGLQPIQSKKHAMQKGCIPLFSLRHMLVQCRIQTLSCRFFIWAGQVVWAFQTTDFYLARCRSRHSSNPTPHLQLLKRQKNWYSHDHLIFSLTTVHMWPAHILDAMWAKYLYLEEISSNADHPNYELRRQARMIG